MAETRKNRRYRISIAGDRSPRSWEISDAEMKALDACFAEGIVMLEGRQRALAESAMTLLRYVQKWEPDTESELLTVYRFGENGLESQNG